MKLDAHDMLIVALIISFLIFGFGLRGGLMLPCDEELDRYNIIMTAWEYEHELIEYQHVFSVSDLKTETGVSTQNCNCFAKVVYTDEVE